jgi:aryl-alcohol dehydrogenase-like predicted oxidoreductase
MNRRRLGAAGPEVSVLGLGCMPRDEVAISVKFGALRDPASGWHGTDGRPESVRNFLGYTLRRLGTDHVDVYRPARVDPSVPIEETVGAIADMVEAGFVRHIGLSEAGADTIRRAAAVHPISDLQIEYSLISRGIEEGILPACRELGIGITA